MPLHVATLPVFLATRREQVPVGCVRYVSVDGSVPGATVTWDHHVSGELVNLDAMPSAIDTLAYDSVCTTTPDTDAVTSAAVVLLGGTAAIPDYALAVMRSASHWCDHLGPHPDLPKLINAAGRGLHGFVVSALDAASTPAERSESFAQLAGQLARAVASGEPLPSDTRILDAADSVARTLDERGAIQRHGVVAVVDLRGATRTSPEALYARFDCPIGLFVEDHQDGGVRYTVGLNPTQRSPLSSVRPMLEALAAAEFGKGPPALGPHASVGQENWGGRETVGGSPWNYASRLTVDEVVAIIVSVGQRQLDAR